MEWTADPWTYPESRYYYGWWNAEPPPEPTDGQIKSLIVDRLRGNPHGRTRTSEWT